MSDDEDDFEELADEIDSPKFSALSLSVADKIDAILEPLDELQKARRNAIIEPFNQLQREYILGVAGPLEELKQARINAIIEPLDELQKARRNAIIDLPEEVFSTAIAASAVSSRARTTSPPTQSPPSTEAPATPNYDDIDAEASDSLYVNNVIAVSSFLAYQIEGLDREQIERATVYIAVCILAGGALKYPAFGEALTVGAASLTVGERLNSRRKDD